MGNLNIILIFLTIDAQDQHQESLSTILEIECNQQINYLAFNERLEDGQQIVDLIPPSQPLK